MLGTPLADRYRLDANGLLELVLHGPALLECCHIVPTSLLAENLSLLPRTGKFMRAGELARV